MAKKRMCTIYFDNDSGELEGINYGKDFENESSLMKADLFGDVAKIFDELREKDVEAHFQEIRDKEEGPIPLEWEFGMRRILGHKHPQDNLTKEQATEIMRIILEGDKVKPSQRRGTIIPLKPKDKN